MPHIFFHLPFPKASLAVLEAFATMARIDLDYAELAAQAKDLEQQLGSMLAQIEKSIVLQRDEQVEAREEWVMESAKDQKSELSSGLSPDDLRRLEDLFEQAGKDRTKAYELKAELDRLKVFSEYEDRFLDLFQDPD